MDLISAVTSIWAWIVREIRLALWLDFDKLMKAVHYGDTQTIEALLQGLDAQRKVEILGRSENKDGYTALIRAAENGAAGTRSLEVLLRDLDGQQKLALLRHKNHSGDTALIQAVGWGQTENVEVLLRGLDGQQKLELLAYEDRFSGNTALGLAAHAHRIRIVEQLLQGLDAQQKLDLLVHRDGHGQSVLVQTVSSETRVGRRALHIETIDALLQGLDEEQKQALFNQETPEGKTPIVFVFERGQHDTVRALQRHGAVLPEHLREIARAQGIPLFEINTAQSTHRASVHDSVARSAIALVARYLENISDTDKNILNRWARGKASDVLDRQHHTAVLDVIKKQGTQTALQKLVSPHTKNIANWLNTLAPESKSTAKSAIARINNIANYKEHRTDLTLTQALSLVWMGMHDEDTYQSIPPAEALADRKKILIRNLIEIQTEYDTGRPACEPGTFHKLIDTLNAGVHPDVFVANVSVETVTIKAQALVLTLFDAADYTREQLVELDAELKRTAEVDGFSSLSAAVKTQFKPKIINALQIEFGGFIEARLLEEYVLERASNDAMFVLRSETAAAIAQKIQACLSEPEVEQGAEQGRTKRRRKGF